MATYDVAAAAKALIIDIARWNNSAIQFIDLIVAKQDELAAMSPAVQQAVRDAINALGYSDVEVQAIMGKWRQVSNTATAQAIVPVAPPR